MINDKKKASGKEIITGIASALALGWLLLGADSGSTFAQQQSRFMGGNPQVADSENVQTARLLFPAGVRSNWHSHSWGQLLMIEEGRGLAQDRGGVVRQYGPGKPFWTPEGVEHWHGAHPEEAALQLTIYEGDVNWLDPVTDAQYHVTPVVQ
tara:strand:+ start:447 stop:902 length:456 start_codon:yes stop_codon:yes gene_type:complete